jgi:hypothetical protein
MISQFPHCDASVLHSPGECEYCDDHPEWQELREAWGIAFTGHQPTERQQPCPSDGRRGTGEAHVWGGNRPTRMDVPQTETASSRVLYGSAPRRTGIFGWRRR